MKLLFSILCLLNSFVYNFKIYRYPTMLLNQNNYPSAQEKKNKLKLN